MCVYCGGAALATTLDHMPPKCMFDGKQRPTGMEYSCCATCNQGARLADLACAMIGRVFPDATTAEGEVEFKKYLVAVRNNIPGLLEEMMVPRASEKLARRRLNLSESDDGGFLRLDGPIALTHLEVFAARLGLATHFEATGRPVSASGAVFVRVFSNVDLLEGRVPEEVFDILPPPTTLAAGRKTVIEQFKFATRAADTGGMSMSFAIFRQSFAVLAFTTNDLNALGKRPSGAKAYRPGALGLVLQSNYRI